MGKTIPLAAQLNDIIFCNHTTGFVVGNNGTILKTADSGDTWTQVSSGTTQNLNAISTASIDNIWTVGDNGTILYSRDEGNTWLIKDLYVSENLKDISFSNNTGYIVGNNSVCFKTTDSGNNWSNNSFNNSGDNLIVQQTKNGHLYILYGADPFGYNLIFDNNIKNAEKTLTSFFMINDSIGYGMLADATTGNNGTLIQISEYKYGDYMGYGFDFNNSAVYDVSHSDILVLNESVGYAITGSILYRINNDVIQAINKPSTNAHFVLKQNHDYLIIIPVKSERVAELVISTLSGMVITKQKGNMVDISRIPSGLYLIKAIFENKGYAIKKWIKY